MFTAFQVLFAETVSKAVTDGPRKDTGAEAPGNGCSNECFCKSLSHIFINSLSLLLFPRQEVKGFCRRLHAAMEATKVLGCFVLLQTFGVGFAPSLCHSSTHHSAPLKSKA